MFSTNDLKEITYILPPLGQNNRLLTGVLKRFHWLSIMKHSEKIFNYPTYAKAITNHISRFITIHITYETTLTNDYPHCGVQLAISSAV